MTVHNIIFDLSSVNLTQWSAVMGPMHVHVGSHTNTVYTISVMIMFACLLLPWRLNISCM